MELTHQRSIKIKNLVKLFVVFFLCIYLNDDLMYKYMVRIKKYMDTNILLYDHYRKKVHLSKASSLKKTTRILKVIALDSYT